MGNVLNTAYKVVADVIESEENINIEQGTLHVIDDKLKVHLDGEIKEVSTKSYKVYTALLTQTGTDAPVATVLENTIGGIVWSREGAGVYLGTLNNAFDINKTWLYVKMSNADDDGLNYITLNNTSEIQILNTVNDWSNTGYTYEIEIRVYN